MASLGKIVFYGTIVLIFLFAGLLILVLTLTFTNSSSGVKSDNMMPIANMGTDELLSCYQPAASDQTSVTDVLLTWEKTSSSAVVYRYKDGAADLGQQDPQFKGRTKVSSEALGRGNASLLLQGVRQSDAGEYTCTLSSSLGSGNIRIQLQVAAFTRPTFKLSGNSLTAEAKRWFPRPNVTWLDFHGNILDENANFTENSAGIFTVVSRLQPINATDTYTFKIENELVSATSSEKFTDTEASWDTYFTFNTASSMMASTYLSLMTSIFCICYLTSP